MKYIIGESRLDDLVQQFITMKIGGPIKKSEITKFSWPLYHHWENKNGEPIFRTLDGSYKLDVEDNLYHDVRKMFSLSKKSADSSFLKWVKNNLKIKSFEGVHVFYPEKD